MKVKYLIYILLSVISLSSCDKLTSGLNPLNSPISNFNFLWNEVNNKYSYHMEKGVDWDAIYKRYVLKINNEMTDKELFNVLADMLNELKDGHVNLSSSFDRSKYWNWFQDYPLNFNKNIIYSNYFGTHFQVTGPFHNKIIDSVLYVYYESFANNITKKNIDEIIIKSKELKGIIIDIRNNGGGSSLNADALAAAFAKSRYIYAYSRMKNGIKKDEFTEWKPLYVNPRLGDRYIGKLVVICNRSTYSAANLFAQMMKVRPNTILIGNRTGGGGGTPLYGEMPNGWIYRLSVTQTINPEGEHIENGIDVDDVLDMTVEDELKGKDTILEKALTLFN